MSREVFDLVKFAENELGWAPKDGTPVWRWRAAYCVRLEDAMKRYGHTTEDIRAAIAYCKTTKTRVEGPGQLARHVGEALTRLADPDERELADDLGQQIQAAIDWESGHGEPDREYWITRLVRSVGPGRADTLTEWKEAGRG